MCLCLLLLSVALLSLLVIAHEETSMESLGLALLSAVYPAFFISILVLGNHFTPTAQLAELGVNSKLFVLFVFVISPSTDSFAYLFGMFLRKVFPQKMAPKLSPNKTVIGGVGGLVGGIVGAVALYFIYTACAGVPTQTETIANTMQMWLPIYIFIGLVGAVVTEFGDLVESCIKRKLGLKDMGRIMPGHGGVLDRIDSVLFTSISTYLLFLLLCVIV
jgi:phosphatidate cytidylyltransferase